MSPWSYSERVCVVEQEQMFYVTGVGNRPDSDELAGYHYLTNPTGYGLQAFRTKEGAEAFVKRLHDNPESRLAQLARAGSNEEALEADLSRGEFSVRRLSREELDELMSQIKVDYLWWRP
jgi:hypothetical protein